MSDVWDDPWNNHKMRNAATKWMREDNEVDLVMSQLDPTHANNLLAGFRAGWQAAEKQLFDDITEETGHLTLAALIGDWHSLKAQAENSE